MPPGPLGRVWALGVVDEPIENGVGIGGLVCCVMLCLHGKLAGHDGEGATVSVSENLEQIMPLN